MSERPTKHQRANTAGKAVPAGQVGRNVSGLSTGSKPSASNVTSHVQQSHGSVHGGQPSMSTEPMVYVNGQPKPMSHVIGDIFIKLNVLDSIENRLSKLEKEIQEIRSVKEEVQVMHAECRSLCTRYEEMQNDNHKCRDVVSSLREQVIDLQSRSMRDNLLFTGIAEAEGNVVEDTANVVQNLLEQKLEIPKEDVDIDRCHRIGVRRRDGRPRTIVVKFRRSNDRERVKKNAAKLKNTNIYINEQFPREIEERRKKLRPILKQAKRDGKRAVLVRDKLYINGDLFKLDEGDRMNGFT